MAFPTVAEAREHQRHALLEVLGLVPEDAEAEEAQHEQGHEVRRAEVAPPVTRTPLERASASPVSDVHLYREVY